MAVKIGRRWAIGQPDLKVASLPFTLLSKMLAFAARGLLRANLMTVRATPIDLWAAPSMSKGSCAARL